ncbi:lipopolysaccharide biosynthesis protein [Pseudokordiimonas caeni]|uniref:lipopolysaccharide biosynthesis protein n=1 Tax=Pseudokordiimonas caeni TaxID=2997908 RepID=UPI002810B33D|nr:oligosaccharide flippase family protein [Pseudokordiimonas caeni]
MRLYKSAIAALAVRGASILLGFGVTFIIAHQLGTAANGQYALVTQTVMLLSVLAVAGTDLSLIKFLTVSKGEKHVLTNRLLGELMIFVLLACFVIGGLLWLSRSLVWNRLFGDIVPIEWIGLLALMLLGRAGGRFISAVLRSQHYFVLGQSIEVLVVPLVVVLYLVGGFAGDVKDVIVINIFASIGCLLAGGLFAWTRKKAKEDTGDVSVSAIVRSGLPLLGVGITQTFTEWFAIAVAASYLGAHETGVMRIAMQLSMVLAIIPTGLWSVFAPKMAAAYNKGDRAELGRLAKLANMTIAMVAVPLAIFISAFAGPILNFISSEAAGAELVVIILVVGQLIAAVMSCMGMLLAMTGHEKVSFRNAMIGTVVMVASGTVFVQLYGIMGLALAIVCTITWRQVSCMVAVVRLLRLNPYTGKQYID